MSQSGPVAPPRRRFSIAGLMALTAAVGLTLAAVRWLVEFDAGWAVLMVPPAVMIELAAFRWSRSRGRMRRFWAGFVLAGLPAMASVVAAATYRDSWINRAWVAATNVIGSVLFDRFQILKPGGNAWVAAVDMVLSIELFPVVTGLCLVGGVAGLGLGRWRMTLRAGRVTDPLPQPAPK